ncbi:MAG TPA: Gfo/Idh/MocA family oxidoreductase, partial [Verrucomicrobiota bacterium]|nr:Gfo/Idh/MocA family oxidoreductase [Verrucomicrobiota bacterium]
MEARVRVAVLGVGSLGRQHTRIYGEMHRRGTVELVGVYDTDSALAKSIAEKHGTAALGSVEAAAAAAEALSIVTPTITHHALAKPLLEQGKHLLIEKPMTDDAAQAADLVRLAKRHDCVLQVGHIERFNPVFNYLREAVCEPRFIESHRLSPYPARSMDIGVVLDLMIHDLDIVLAFVRSPVEHVDAAG